MPLTHIGLRQGDSLKQRARGVTRSIRIRQPPVFHIVRRLFLPATLVGAQEADCCPAGIDGSQYAGSDGSQEWKQIFCHRVIRQSRSLYFPHWVDERGTGATE